MDRVAEALALDPVRLRERNALRPGDTMATGQVLGDDASALAVLREAVKRSDFNRKRRAWRGTSRGIGLSLYFHGAGFTGSGEVMLASRAALELTPTGARILVGSTEMGQGTRTTLAQIVAEELDGPSSGSRWPTPTPRSFPTAADRCLPHLHGGGRPPEGLRDGDEGAARRSFASRLPEAARPLTLTRQYEPPPGVAWDDAAYRGDAYATYGWGCTVAELEKDPSPTRFGPRE